MNFLCSENRHEAWRDHVLEKAVRFFDDEPDLPAHFLQDRERAVRAAFSRHVSYALRHPSPETRLARTAFVRSSQEEMIEILQRIHAGFWHLGLSSVENGSSPDELNELALFQTAFTAVWINNAIHRGTIYAAEGGGILVPPLGQIWHVMKLLRDG